MTCTTRNRRLGTAIFICAALSGPISAQERKTYVYDVLGRVSSANSTAGPRIGDNTNYSYDPAGNRQCYGASLSTSNALCSMNVAITQANLTVTGSSANQGSPVKFTVTRGGNLQSAVTVRYSTVEGSAKAGANFQSMAGTLTFLPGVAAQSVSVPTINPGIKKPDLQFTMAISMPSDGAVLLNDGASGTIVNTNPAVIIAGSTSISVPNCQASSFDVSTIVVDQAGLTYSIQSVTAPATFSGTRISFSAPGLTTSAYTYTVRNSAGLTASGKITLTGVSAPGICAR